LTVLAIVNLFYVERTYSVYTERDGIASISYLALLNYQLIASGVPPGKLADAVSRT